MGNNNFITIKIGKDISVARVIDSLQSGIQNQPETIIVKCRQAPDIKMGDYAFVWLGSNNNKGGATEWDKGLKAFGRVIDFERAEQYNDESITKVTIVYSFEKAIRKVDFLKFAPIAYYWCSSLPNIALDDSANQAIRSIPKTGLNDIKAFFSAIDLVTKNFRNDILKIEPNFKCYFGYDFPDPVLYSHYESLYDVEKNSQAKNLKPQQILFFGTPGSGKSWKVENEVLPSNEKYIFRTTFHPDTDYSSFVGCYKPQMKDDKIVYGFAPQVFTDAYVAAWNGLPDNEKYYLVIEEINRGNCAQIFGDLFQLLDRKKGTGYSEYPIKADNDLRDYLQSFTDEGVPVLINREGIKDGKLCLPPNLNIIATMNTSDQSLFPMDSAFKRRWSWEYVPIKYDEPKSAAFTMNIPDSPFEKWVNFLKKINGIILEKTDSEDKQMGNFFIKGDIEEQEFKDKVMFYLWSEVCKDSFHTKDNFFRTKDREFSYNELYGDEGHDLLLGFLDYIKNYKAKDDQTV